MTPLYPGQLCFVTGVSTDSELVGLPVTVIGRVHDPDLPYSESYLISSHILKLRYRHCDFHIERTNLKPLFPPYILPGVTEPATAGEQQA